MVFTTPRCLIASGTPRRYKRCGAYMTMRESPQGMEASIGCAAGDGMGGGIFAKTAKTPPLQSALRGYRCGGLPSTIICAHVGINGNGAEEDHDAACRVVIKNLPRVLL